MIYLKNRIKRNLALSVSIVLLAGSMAACKNSKPASTVEKENPNAKSTTLTVELFDRAKPGQAPLDNNYWTRYIDENFGKKY